MWSIYLNYISDYICKETRGRAFHNLMIKISENADMLSGEESKDLLIKANQFSTEFNNAPFWKKSKVVALAIRIEI